MPSPQNQPFASQVAQGGARQAPKSIPTMSRPQERRVYETISSDKHHPKANQLLKTLNNAKVSGVPPSQ